MLMPDVNILMYAHREEEKCHESYAKWLKALIDGAELSRPSAGFSLNVA
jgi:predicted nucleic acid-binding protein